MTYTNLGHTGLKVGRLALGTMNFGPKTSEEESHAILDQALEMGINLVDTADIYGYRKTQGMGAGWTEEIIGCWLAEESGRRDRIVLATKVFSRMGDGTNDRGLSVRHVRRACEASLRRLQTDHIDLYADIGESPTTVALAWVLANPVVTAAIIGPRTCSQLEASLRALDLRLSEDMLRRLDAIWPGPGEAPEGYAW